MAIAIGISERTLPNAGLSALVGASEFAERGPTEMGPEMTRVGRFSSLAGVLRPNKDEKKPV
jgi:hypothetical protein